MADPPPAPAPDPAPGGPPPHPAPCAAFVVPGDIRTRTGGYLYDRRLIEAMARLGRPVRLIEAPAAWPDPDEAAQDALIRRLRALPPQAPVILDGLVFGAIATEALAGIDAPLIAMLHHPLGLEPGLPPARAARLLAQEAANLRHAAQVVVPSAHVAQMATSRLGVPAGRVRVARPGFDRPEPSAPAPAPAHPPLILSVGIICARKGHDVLLRALARIAHLDWRAAVAGMVQDRQLHRDLLALRDDLGLSARVAFLGEVDPDPLERLFRTARIFALATRYEGYGMVLAEAQIHGLPIVSCAVGAVPLTVPPEAGLLVPPDDPEAFGAALERVLADRRLAEDLASGSERAGRGLPRWDDAARVMCEAVAQAAPDRGPRRRDGLVP